MLLRYIERPRHWLLLAALMVASQQLASAGLIYAKAALAPILMERAWRSTLADGGRVHKPWPWADTWPVARLQVAALGIDQFVLAGASGNALAFGPGLDAAGTRPGQPGTAVIAGHRDTHFRFLQHLQPSMSLQLQLPDGRRLRYRVTGGEVIDTRLGSQLPARDGQASLELVTCFPFNALRAGGPLRYIVRAEPGPSFTAKAAALESTHFGVPAL